MRFLLVDRITSFESGKRASGIKNVTLSEDFFTHHFPNHPIMPGALITECLVQLADWVVRECHDFNCIGLPASFETLKFHRLVRPGDQLRLEVELLGTENGHCSFKGQARCENEVVAAARFTLHIEPAEAFQPRDESQRLFELISAC